ncbi:MAG: biotin carboxylase N-terminal domain-containing protein [Acetobacteraceae bacterium]
MFRKILIANRGEIACRIMATCERLGIASVAVYSAADQHARHVDLADEAWPIGPPPAAESYLAIDTILEVARRAGAEAIHPGYGFLAENADFAARSAAAGRVFIGPPPQAIRAMGSKSAAKTIMQRSGVPLVPGYHDEAQDLATLSQAANRIGYPVLVKASGGGGGKGMRVVAREADLEAALEGAKREALAAFGDDRLLLEKYLAQARHIEIQIFADTHGNFVSLFERDCSIQRRYQKVIEEAPAPGMAPARRRRMGEAAIAAARAVGYVGAGTVEFIAEGDDFYFMEMNTRLQVEHPVTEMITGQDLVEWQLRVAAGEALPLGADRLAIHGHAIEARVYAEDPVRDFLPSIGTLIHLRQPPGNAPGAGAGHVRVDTGVRQGDEITPWYDPMIAKLIVWGEDRNAALRRLAGALTRYEIVGVATNLDLLRAITDDAAYARGEFDTGFIARHQEQLMPVHPPALSEADERAVWAAAALAVIAQKCVENAAVSQQDGDPFSPWRLSDAWRMNGDGYQDLVFRRGDATTTLRARPQEDGSFRLDLPGGSVRARWFETEFGTDLRVDGVSYRLRVIRRGTELTVILGGRNHLLHEVDPLAPPLVEAGAETRLTAPIPARLARLLVKPGDQVKKGAVLVVLEAMKMELTLAAPLDGTVATIRHAAGDMVEEGEELVTFAASGA